LEGERGKRVPERIDCNKVNLGPGKGGPLFGPCQKGMNWQNSEVKGGGKEGAKKKKGILRI